MAKVKIQGSAGLGGTVVVTAGTNSTTKHIQSFPACTITVYEAGTLTLASLWTDSAGTVPKANPFTASASDASWSAYVTAGHYDVRFSGTGIDVPFTLGDVIVSESFSAFADASVADKGVTKLSVAPLSASNPIAVGDNDIRVGVDSADYASLAAAVTAIGATPTNLVVTGALASGASTTVPSTLRLSFAPSGSIVLGAGHTVIIRSDPSLWPETQQIFSGTGTVSFSGSTRIDTVHPEWWGAVADGSTDCTSAIQAAVNVLNAANIHGTVKFKAGVYIIAGALQDVGASNSQIVLPKRTTMLSLAFEGAAPSINAAFTRNEGTVLRSTLASGTGAAIGVRGTMTVTSITDVTYLSFHFRNISLQLVDNPTNTGLDLSRVPEVSIYDAQVSTSVDPSVLANITEPTTATSYAIKLPPNNLAFPSQIQRVQIFGFYNGIQLSELTEINGATITFCKVGLEIANGYHLIKLGRVWIAYVARCIKFTGGAGAGLAGAIIEGNHVSFETVAAPTSPAWAATVYHIDDPDSHALGTIRCNVVKNSVGITSELLVNGGLDVSIVNIYESWDSRWNTIAPYATYDAEDNATFELYRRVPATANTGTAALNLVSDQAGTTAIVGRLMGINKAIGVAEKRISGVNFSTDGATNSGKIDFVTFDAGVSGLRFSIMKNSVIIHGLAIHANNAAAAAAGLAVGALYRTGADPDVVCVVH